MSEHNQDPVADIDTLDEIIDVLSGDVELLRSIALSPDTDDNMRCALMVVASSIESAKDELYGMAQATNG